MATIEVTVQRDHLERLANQKTPFNAICELIWNSLDADSSIVQVKFRRNKLGGIDRISVSDDGNGIPYKEALQVFKNLGGSWKTSKSHSPQGRILHGKRGQGRFHALALGDHVSWTTRYNNNGTVHRYRIETSKDKIKHFEIGDEEAAPRTSKTGTEVEISGISKKITSLDEPNVVDRLTEEFALYLRQYPAVKIGYDGKLLDPKSLESHVEEIDLDPITISNNETVSVAITVIEWKTKKDRALHICDHDGFTLITTPPRFHAPGFSFTVYLKSEFFRKLDDENSLVLDHLDPDLNKIIELSKQELKAHFRARSAKLAEDLVREWKEEEIYPFTEEARNIVEEAERQVFDIVALNINEYLPKFQDSPKETKKFSFTLIKNAIENSPDSLRTIITDVISLPDEKKEEFAELLEKTDLESIIGVAKLISDRLDFVQGLELLVFDQDSKTHLKERSQLHKIIAEESWIFGEQFNLSLSDRSLTTVLKKHIQSTNIEILDDSPVLRANGKTGIVDLMLSRVIPQADPQRKHHLVVELKKPSAKLNQTFLSQTKSYAYAIAQDERFNHTDTTWDFWLISNEMNKDLELEARQADRPHGLVVDSKDPDMRIWIKTWGQLINGCKARLNVFAEQLQYAADESSGLAYLKNVHGSYLPTTLSHRNTSI